MATKKFHSQFAETPRAWLFCEYSISFAQIPQGLPVGMKLLCLPFRSDVKGENLRPVNPWYAVNGRAKDEHR